MCQKVGVDGFLGRWVFALVLVLGTWLGLSWAAAPGTAEMAGNALVVVEYLDRPMA